MESDPGEANGGEASEAKEGDPNLDSSMEDFDSSVAPPATSTGGQGGKRPNVKSETVPPATSVGGLVADTDNIVAFTANSIGVQLLESTAASSGGGRPREVGPPRTSLRPTTLCDECAKPWREGIYSLVGWQSLLPAAASTTGRMGEAPCAT